MFYYLHIGIQNNDYYQSLLPYKSTLCQKLIQSYIKTEIKNDKNENNYFKTNSFLFNKKKIRFYFNK